MKKLIIIGSGQLGSRHLQALSKINFPAQIEVVDTFPRSLELAKARFEEMPFNANISSIKYFTSVYELSKKVDIAIIATNADIRADVVRTLVGVCDVQSLILEKVLFQRLEDYVGIQMLLEEKGVRAWVNHSRRAFPFYQRLKNLLSGSRQVSYHAQGGDWGLGCNGLHMIDHLAFLTGEDDLKISTTRLNRTVIQSKRKGFIEFSGVLAGQVGSHPFELFCHDTASPNIITICSDNLNVIIDEANGWVRIAKRENGWQWEEEREKIVYFQSELTNKLAEDIVQLGRCDLPTYDEAIKLHLPFINGLINHLYLIEHKKYEFCPIT